MNELQITTLKLEPAVVEFNKEQVIKELRSILSKYENLVFTEENTADIRSTLAELRKGRTAADTYRKDIKKKLTAPVTTFEKEMKEITGLFDELINPINEQLNEFEARRKEEKRQEVQTIIDETVEELQLEKKFASQLIVEDNYLNKSTSIRQIKETIEFRGNNLLNEQKLEIMNRENIESFVKLKNSENDLSLSVVAYLSQLEFKSVDEVKQTIEDDVNSAITEREKQVIKEAEKIVHEKELEEHNDKEESKTVETPINVAPMPDEVVMPSKYTIFATNEQHELLKEFLQN